MTCVGDVELDGDLGVVVQLGVVVRVGVSGDVFVQLSFCCLYVSASTHADSVPGGRDDQAFLARRRCNDRTSRAPGRRPVVDGAGVLM